MVTHLLGLVLLASTPAVAFAGEPCELGETAPGKVTARFVVIGDFGEHDGEGLLGRDPWQVLDAISTLHRQQAFDFGLTVGDNFYPRGTKTIPEHRRRWRSYESLGIPFYASLGNHDYFDGRARTQVRYGAAPIDGQPRTWIMPCRYYTFAAGPVRLIALDTDEGTQGWARKVFTLGLGRRPWSTHQAAWLERQLKSSTAPWTFVYGHHPVFSRGPHGDTGRLRDLHPLMARHKTTAYIAGHDHSLQHMTFDDVVYLVAGAGGRETTRVRCDGNATCERLKDHFGFLVVEASTTEWRWTFFDQHGNPLLPERQATR